MAEWISVDSSLPPVGEVVLVACIDEYGAESISLAHIWQLVDDGRIVRWHRRIGAITDLQDVEFWMSIPAVPALTTPAD